MTEKKDQGPETEISIDIDQMIEEIMRKTDTEMNQEIEIEKEDSIEIKEKGKEDEQLRNDYPTQYKSFYTIRLNIILLLDEQSRDPPIEQWSIQENIKL